MSTKRSLLYQGNDTEMATFTGDRFRAPDGDQPAQVFTAAAGQWVDVQPGQYVVADHMERLSVVNGDELGSALLP